MEDNTESEDDLIAEAQRKEREAADTMLLNKGARDPVPEQSEATTFEAIKLRLESAQRQFNEALEAAITHRHTRVTVDIDRDTQHVRAIVSFNEAKDDNT